MFRGAPKSQLNLVGAHRVRRRLRRREPVSRRLANRWWNETCRAAKIDDLHFHDLRREFGSTLKDLGVPLADIRDALGHSNVTMTNTYLAAESQSVKKAIMKNAAHRARKQMKVVGR